MFLNSSHVFVLIDFPVCLLLQMYRNMVEPPFPETEYGTYMAMSHLIYEVAVKSFPAPDPPPE